MVRLPLEVSPHLKVMGKICIVSYDRVFARLLEIELNEIGLKPKLICEKLNPPALGLALGSPRLIIWDGEYYENDLSFIEKQNAEVLLFDKKRVAELPSNVSAFFERPFSVTEFVETVASFYGAPTTPSRIPTLQASVPMELDQFSKQVTVNGNIIKFSPREFALLSLLYKNRGRIVSRKEVIDTVWGKDYNTDNNADNVYINYLRKKLDAPLGLKLIYTIRGKGYMLK